MFAVATISESYLYLYLHDLCVFCVCFMYILCVYGPSAWNKTDDDDDDGVTCLTHNASGFRYNLRH